MTTIRKDQVKNIAVTTSDTQTLTNKTLTQEDWHLIGASGEPAFENSWVNYGYGFNSAGFFKDSCGIVHLKGLVKNGSISSTTAIFTLPSGYRPVGRELFNINSNAALGRCDVTTTGGVIAHNGNATWFSLDGITFRAA